jgi:hypothetical protein
VKRAGIEEEVMPEQYQADQWSHGTKVWRIVKESYTGGGRYETKRIVVIDYGCIGLWNFLICFGG